MNIRNLKFSDAEIKLIYKELGYRLAEVKVARSEMVWTWKFWKPKKYTEVKYNVVRLYAPETDIEILSDNRFKNLGSLKHDWNMWPNFRWPRTFFEAEILPQRIKQIIFPELKRVEIEKLTKELKSELTNQEKIIEHIKSINNDED